MGRASEASGSPRGPRVVESTLGAGCRARQREGLLRVAAQKLYGPTFNPQITLKALSFFDDGDLRQLPDDMKLRLVTAARNVDLDRLPSLDNPARKIDQDHGHEL